MQDILDGIKRFKQDIYPGKSDLFRHLATHHKPAALFIGCSDARVVPELITQRDPGELFVIRNAGNIVPPYTAGAEGIAASIEYAVSALQVSDVIVCGHSACGAMTAVASGESLDELPAVAAWLQHAETSKARAEGRKHSADADPVGTLVRENVLAQLANLRTHPSVARALAQQKVTLHGWVFDIPSGSIETVDADTGRSTAVV